MESFDITLKGQDGIMYVSRQNLRIDTDDITIVDTGELASIGMVGSQRLLIVWGYNTRHIITVRVMSAPARAALETIRDEFTI